jgi:hypothetical protein
VSTRIISTGDILRSEQVPHEITEEQRRDSSFVEQLTIYENESHIMKK